MDKPVLGKNVFVAEGAIIKGNVNIGDESSVWFNAVIRTEKEPIMIGKCTNIQDNCVLHVDPNTRIVIGDRVTIGHGAIIHGCSIGDETLIGMGAIVMNNAVIGKHCIIGAGAIVTEGVNIPDNSVVMGAPGKIKRSVSDEEAKHLSVSAEHYRNIARDYMNENV